MLPHIPPVRAATTGTLQSMTTLLYGGGAHSVLANDYAKMLADGTLLDENEPFDALVERCASIEVRANSR